MSREHHFVLSDNEKANLQAIAAQLGREMEIYTQTDCVVEKILPKIKSVMPSDVLEVIEKMQHGEGPELITISNLPVDEALPEGDSLEDKVAAKTRVSEVCLLGINALLDGHFQEEKSSHQLGFIHQITPVKKFVSEASGRGGGSIPFHAENVFVKRNPGVLSLFCLRGEAGVETEYIYVSDIIKYLDDEIIAMLKEPIYSVVSGDGFERKSLDNTPVLDHDESGWRVCRFYEEDRIFSDSPAGQAAIDKLHEAITQARDNDLNAVELSSGTLLLFFNATRKGQYGGVLHGRRGDMTVKRTQKTVGQRWLQRVCVELPYQ